MKKRILIFALLLTTLVSSSFARNNDGVNKLVTASFRNEFSSAREVKRENTKEFIKVSFIQNEQIWVAYYTHEGEFMAATRNISSTELPKNLYRTVKKYFKDSWITDLFVVNTENGTDYFVSMENSDMKVVLRSSGTYGWQVYSKEPKL